jgi:hypothetical protein
MVKWIERIEFIATEKAPGKGEGAKTRMMNTLTSCPIFEAMHSILAINGGSSSIKFALYQVGESLKRVPYGKVDRVGLSGTSLTFFLPRTRGPFWSIRPTKIVWVAVVGTQVITTFSAVYGFLVRPLGWGWAGFVWCYALLWFLVIGRRIQIYHLANA